MLDISSTPNALATVTAGIGAIGALGMAASGLVDGTKAFGGGVSNAGFGSIKAALRPFQAALDNGQADWSVTIRANWLNGMPKEDQKAAANSLIRLGLSSKNAAAMAVPGHVDPVALEAVLKNIEIGAALTPEQVNLLGRFNGAIDAAMDAGFERGDQKYRNVSRLVSGIVAVGLAIWAGWLLSEDQAHFWGKNFGAAFIVGLIAVPLAPVAKDLTSALQAAAGALKGGKP